MEQCVDVQDYLWFGIKSYMPCDQLHSEMIFALVIIVIILSILGGFGLLYLLSKKHPKLSRELHKQNCDCKVCRPITTGDKDN